MKYTEEHIRQFYEVARQLPQNVDKDRIFQLIDNPPPGGGGTSYGSSFSPFKLMMMSATAIIISAMIFFWVKPENETEKIDRQEKIETIESVRSALTDTIAQKSAMENLNLIAKERIKTGRVQPKTDLIQKPKLESKGMVKMERPQPANLNDQEKSLPAISCDWPEDTVIYVSELVVELNEEEARKLGFEFIDFGKSGDEWKGGVYYSNYYKGEYSTSLRSESRWKITDGIRTTSESTSRSLYLEKADDFPKKDYSHFSFYPIFESDDGFEPKGELYYYRGRFEEFRDKIIPVRLTGNYTDSHQLFYFKVNDDFFDALPDRYQYLSETFGCIQDLKRKTGREQVLLYQSEQVLQMGHFLYLDQVSLEKIGFTITDTVISFKYITPELLEHKLMLTTMGRTAYTAIDLSDKSSVVYNDLNLLLMTDENGKQTGSSWNFDPSRFNKYDQRQFDLKYQLLVPIVLTKEQFPNILTENRVIWFEPTDSLFANLPPEIGEELKRDYEYLTAEDKSDLEAKCTFFTICQTELKINSFNLFPNPATEKVNINFSLSEDLKASVGIYDLQGKLLNQPITDQQYFKGINAIEVKLNGLAAGVYLLKLSTTNGYKIQRFIVE